MPPTRRLRHRLVRLLRAAAGRATAHNVNVAGASNVVVSRNVGSAGVVRHASSSQTVRVRQPPGTVETDVETSVDDR